MLARFPPPTLEPGDVIVTNDPWIGTGHLFDINVMQPVFRDGAHRRLHDEHHAPARHRRRGVLGATAREVYEEGLRMPLCQAVPRRHARTSCCSSIVRTNVRVPEQTIGDLLANVSCTTVGARMLNEFMDEYGLESIDAAGRRDPRASPSARSATKSRGCPRASIAIASSIEGAGRAAHARLRDRDRRRRGRTPTSPGSSAAIGYAINVPLCYTRAMTCYAIKCLTTPRIPNNEGSVRADPRHAPPRAASSMRCRLRRPAAGTSSATSSCR